MTTAPPASEEVARLLRRATYASVAVATTLVAAKLVAYLATGSVAVLSALADSLLDMLASLVNLVAVRHALQPADSEHRFGHGKAEPLAGLAQAIVIAASAGYVLVEAAQRLVAPVPVEHPEIGIAVAVGSAVATIALVRYQGYVVKRTGSLAITADALHYRADLFLNGGVVLALVLGMWLDWRFLDPMFAVALATIILVSAWAIVRQSFDMLMDRELPDEERDRIKSLVLEDAQVMGIHGLRTRKSGQSLFVQLDMEVDGSMSLARAHAIAASAAARIETAFPGADVMIHQDPKAREGRAAAS